MAAGFMNGAAWVVGGDFNCVLTGRDKPNGMVDSASTGFQLMVQTLGLSEYPSSGIEFTWRNGSGLMSKIDRFFGNAGLLDMFQLSSVCGLEHPFSDHTPLVWDSGEQVLAGSYFKFEKSWLREPGFREMLEG